MKSSKEQLSKVEHTQMLSNKKAEELCKFTAIKKYKKLGYDDKQIKNLIG